MNAEERKAAAAVMSSDGPFQVRSRDGEYPWVDCLYTDGAGIVWNWELCEYRVRPAPAPLPCPCCGSLRHHETPEGSRWCTDCCCSWLPDRRAPCRECERNRQAAADWETRYQASYIAGKRWDNLCADKAKLLKDRDEWCAVATGLHDKLKRSEGIIKRAMEWMEGRVSCLSRDLQAILEGRKP